MVQRGDQIMSWSTGVILRNVIKNCVARFYIYVCTHVVTLALPSASTHDIVVFYPVGNAKFIHFAI